MTKAMSIRDCYSTGYDMGWNCASWQPFPAIGELMPRDADWIGIGEIKDYSDQIAVFETMVKLAEENARCFSPFEFTANAINNRDLVYGEGESLKGWDAYEKGMQAGITAYRKRYYPVWKIKRDNKAD